MILTGSTDFVLLYQQFFYLQVVLLALLTGINSQHGSSPPRLGIPGAIPIPVRQPIQYRNERLVSGGPNVGFVRIRRPLLASRQTSLNVLQQNNLADEAKPVTEEPESEENPSYLAQFVPQQVNVQQQQQPLKSALPAILYSTDENGEILEQNRPIEYSTTRFAPTERIIPTTLRTTSAQRFSLNQDRSPIVQTPKPVNDNDRNT